MFQEIIYCEIIFENFLHEGNGCAKFPCMFMSLRCHPADHRTAILEQTAANGILGWISLSFLSKCFNFPGIRPVISGKTWNQQGWALSVYFKNLKNSRFPMWSADRLPRPVCLPSARDHLDSPHNFRWCFKCWFINDNLWKKHKEVYPSSNLLVRLSITVLISSSL